MAKKTRYYSEDDPEVGVTLAQLKRLSRNRQLAYMEGWFRNFYEDPVHSLPYVSAEGGYQYIYGGPYDANETLQDEFGGVIGLNLIEELADDLQGESYEWSPSLVHPHRQHDEEEERFHEEEPDLEAITDQIRRGVEPRFDDQLDKPQRANILRRIDVLEATLTRPIRKIRPKRYGGMGHNNPPPNTDPDQPRDEEIVQAAEDIKAELLKPRPDVLVIAKSTSKLKKIGIWFAKKADKAADKFSETIGAAGAVILIGYPMATTIAPYIHEIVHATTRWLDMVLNAF
jgi:hypothetical protein